MRPKGDPARYKSAADMNVNFEETNALALGPNCPRYAIRLDAAF